MSELLMHIGELEQELGVLLTRQSNRRNQLEALYHVEAEAKKREKVVIKLVALERAKVAEMKKQMSAERTFSMKKEKLAEKLQDEVEDLRTASPDASRKSLDSMPSPVQQGEMKRELEQAKRKMQSQQAIIEQLQAELGRMENQHEKQVEKLTEEIQALKASGLKVLSPAEKKRRSVLDELIKTEESYLEDLIALNGVVLLPLMGADFGKELVREDLTPMIDASRLLLGHLRQDENGERTSAILSDFVTQAMTPYSNYASTTFAEVTKALLNNSKSFASFRKKVESDYRLKGLPLEATIIKPVQRICRYPLLLGEIIKATPQDKEEEMRSKLEAVKERFDEAVLTVNEIRRESENMNRALGLQRIGVGGLEDDFEFWGSKRRLLREEGAMVTKDDHKVVPSTVCMFTDCILVVRDKKMSLSPRKERSDSGLMKGPPKSAGVIPQLLKARMDLVALMHFNEHLVVKQVGSMVLELSDAKVNVSVKFAKSDIRSEWAKKIQDLLSIQQQSLSRQRNRRAEVISRGDSKRASTRPSDGGHRLPTPLDLSPRRDSASPPPRSPRSAELAPKKNAAVGFLEFVESGDKDEILEYLNMK